MDRIEGLEKLGRLVLWLALASMFVIVPLEYLKAQATADQAKEAVKKAQEKLEEALKAKDAKPARLSLDDMDPVFSFLDMDTYRGTLEFTNASAREGVLCVALQGRDVQVLRQESARRGRAVCGNSQRPVNTL